MPMLDVVSLLSPENQKLLRNHACREEYAADVWLTSHHHGFSGIRIIESGSVEIHACNSSGEPVLVRTAGPGEYLGVRSFLRPQSEPETRWRSASATSCLELDGDTLRMLLMQENPELHQALEEAAQLREKNIFLSTHPVFSLLPREWRQRVFQDSQVVTLEKGESLLQQGYTNQDLHLILSGSLNIMRNKQSIAVRTAGDLIGEITLFGLSQEATADAVACEWSEVLVIPGAIARNACRASSEVTRALSKLAERNITRG